ncbi:RNA polymerase sigma-70 factor [Pedobacter frigidisoli]|uniref:RNA polymerase sigma-70 factor n=1 Tax=Pedobacter frigidisoli TaxID=2530455 RepID=A0A4R0NJM3_9SPHI|nr:RNA polymerase sigma-70 factor [Pedobacter frigidisoli]TCD00736.1 RNA polymerase sigma-70 factor [Pedobacter frigidisoli]
MHIYQTFSDTDLLSLFKSGDLKAYEEIYKRYWPLLFISSNKILQDEDDAKDVIQEVFISLFNKGASIEIQFSLSVYLYSAVRYRVLDKIRHGHTKDNYLLSLYDYSEASTVATDGKLLEKEFIIQIEKAVAVLPEKMRKIFEMSRNQHLSHAEIARELGISDKTVKKQIGNALKIIRNTINPVLVTALLMEMHSKIPIK